MEMDKGDKPDLNQADTPSETSQADQSRRRFAQVVTGSGVILSLASKPVMGSSYFCTGSGGMSGNTSSHGTRPSCLACSPGYWKTCPNKWASPYYPYKIKNCSGTILHQPTKFSSVFGSCAYGSDKTMMYVLQNYNGTRDWHACGALLNAAKSASLGLASAYTVAEVVSMYKKGAPATTFSSTYSGSLHNCPLSNSSSNYYEAEPGTLFYYTVDSNGKETTTVCKCGY
jgi:hypothetical protein